MKKTDPQVAPLVGDVDPTFELNATAQLAFTRICGLMRDMGTLSPTYSDMITSTASAIGRMVLAEEDLNERGHISHSERGEVKNQSFTVYATAQSLAQKGLSALGLTPTTLGKIVTQPKEDTNPFSEFA